ncbi:MAG: cupin domain-containing protein [Candidatus Sulfotelmatobacter sp.]
MLCRFLCTVAIVCLVVNSAPAQDPTKVEPKHYKLLFENERVQVVSVHYGPHEKSEMHDHPGGVVVIVKGGHLRFTDQNGKVTETFARTGEARWFPPFKHKVENVGDEPYDAVYVGIKGKVTEVGANAGQQSTLTSAELAKTLVQYAATTAKP